MILCDRCANCYHPDCALSSGGTPLHGGPYFCHRCMGELVHQGFTDIMEDWPLQLHMCTGWLLEDIDESHRIRALAGHFWANQDELQIWYPATAE